MKLVKSEYSNKGYKMEKRQCRMRINKEIRSVYAKKHTVFRHLYDA
jgi:hypothetical protein